MDDDIYKDFEEYLNEPDEEEPVNIDGYIRYSRLTPFAKKHIEKCEIEILYGESYVSKTTLMKAQVRALYNTK